MCTVSVVELRCWLQDKCHELTVQVSELRQKLQASRAQAMLALKEKQDELPVRHNSTAAQSVQGYVELPAEPASVPDAAAQVSPGKDTEGLVTQQSLASNTGQEEMTDYWKKRCSGLQREVDLLQSDLADQMRVHELRDMADGAKTQEIHELQAVKSRSSVDVEYLKNALVGFFEAGQLPHNEQVLVVLDRLLSFTARDRSRIWKQRQNDKGIVSSLFGS